jgi:hypothetical protein
MEKAPFIVLGLLVIVALLSLTLSSCSKKNPVSEEDLGFTITSLRDNEVIRAENLWKAYLANKEKADTAYHDKVILVTGKVRFFTPKRKTKDLTPSIILEKDNNASSFIKGIQCTFKGVNINEIAPDIKLGDEITIKGKCIGKIVNVFLSDCEIVPPGSLPVTSREDLPVASNDKPPSQEMILISAVDLWSTYQAIGTLKAHDMFYQKSIQVKGLVRFMGPPRFWRGNSSFLILEAGVDSISPIVGIQCEFDGNFLTDFPTLKKGDEVTIEGIGSSKFSNIFIKKCKITNLTPVD